MADKSPKIDTRHKLHGAYAGKWQRCRDAYDGSDAIKARGEAYLPKLGSHAAKPEKYREYQTRATFFNATGRTVDGLVGAIFQKPPVCKVPNVDEALLKRITLDKKSVELFATDVGTEVLKIGRHGILVDMPDEKSARAAGRDPETYVVGYDGEFVVNWRTERRGDEMVLTRVVLKEIVCETDPEDEAQTLEIEQYRVLRLDGKGDASAYTQEIWRKKPASNDFEKIEVIQPVRRGAKLTFIPFVFVNPTSNSPEPQKPPLDDLVQVNIAHYRNSADYEHGLHFTALPTAVVSGIKDDKSGSLLIGSETAWVLQVGGQAQMLEFSGAGLSAIADAMLSKKKEMATLGARLLEDGDGTAETATAVSMRHAGDHATLRTVAQSVESAIATALRWVSWWMGTVATPEEIEVVFELNKDYFATTMTPAELAALIAALQAESISYKTFYARLQAGGIARPNVTAEEEQAAIAAEGGGAAASGETDVPCPTCAGSGDCPTCGGDGETDAGPCPSCDASGACAACGGTGKVKAPAPGAPPNAGLAGAQPPKPAPKGPPPAPAPAPAEDAA